MSVTRAKYLHDAVLLDMLERDLGGAVGLPLELDGSEVAPTSGTATVYKPDGTVLQTGAIAIVGTEGQTTISAATLVGVDLSLDYYIVWDLLFALVSRQFKTRLGIVRWAPVCPVSDAQLSKYRPTLKARVLRGTGQTSLQDWIEIGWDRVQRWLYRKGSRAELVVDASELYEITEAWVLSEIYADAAVGSGDINGMLAEEAGRWRDTLKDLKDTIQLTYDTDESGQADEIRSGSGSVWLCASGSAERVW